MSHYRCYSCGTLNNTDHYSWCVEYKGMKIPVIPEDAVMPCLFLPEEDSIEQNKVYNTTVDVKRENFPKFAKLISNQFNHGGDKYKLHGFEDREATDVISSVFGGESEFDWVLGTMMKYLFRFKNFHREKDLLKISTYCYILWLKMGAHLKDADSHDEDTNK